MSHNKPDSKSPRGRKRPELQIVPGNPAPELDPDQVNKDRESARGILEKPTEELPWLDQTKEEGPELPN